MKKEQNHLEVITYISSVTRHGNPDKLIDPYHLIPIHQSVLTSLFYQTEFAQSGMGPGALITQYVVSGGLAFMVRACKPEDATFTAYQEVVIPL